MTAINPQRGSTPEQRQQATPSRPPEIKESSWFGRKSELIQGQIKKILIQTDSLTPLIHVPVRKRAIYVTKHIGLRISAFLFHHTAKLFTRLDDLLVWIKSKYTGKVSHQDARTTILGPLIAENTEVRTGRSWPSGLPAHELALYTNPTLIVLEGGDTNKYGHALIAFEGPSGNTRFVQISSSNWYPEHLTGDEFEQYCQRWKCHISHEIKLPCPDVQRLQEGVNELSKKKWLWGGPYHNCLSFVMKLASYGGMDQKLFRAFKTVSNSYPTEVLSGFQRVIDETVNTLVPENDRSKIIEQLHEALEQSIEETEHQPDNTKKYLEKVLEKLLRTATQLEITPDIRDRLLERLSQNAHLKLWDIIEQANHDFLINYFGGMTDMPIHAAQNMPVHLRNVGPQSYRGFNDDSGL